MRTVGHISRLVVFVLAGLVFATIAERPAWTLPLIVLDSPLTLRLSAPWLIALLLALLVSAGTDLLLDPDAAGAEMTTRGDAAAWILPSMVAVVGALLIARFEPLSARWIVVFVGVGLSLSLALLGEVYVVDLTNRHRDAIRYGLLALTYAVGLLVFVTVYSAHVRTALSGTATALASFLLALSLLRWPTDRSDSRWPYAVTAALIVGLATWGLNRAALDSLTGGGVLLLEFYVVTGLARQLIQREFTWRVLIEFAVVAAVGLLLIGVFAGAR